MYEEALQDEDDEKAEKKIVNCKGSRTKAVLKEEWNTYKIDILQGLFSRHFSLSCLMSGMGMGR